MFIWTMVGILDVPIRLIIVKRINKMDGAIGFEMSLIVIEAIRGRCASFTVLTERFWRYLVDRQIIIF